MDSMTSFSRTLLALAVALGCEVATAGEEMQRTGGHAMFTMSLPVVLPGLVVVQPGVSVVPGMDVEVFYAGGYYWTRRDASWYRTRDHNGGWVWIDERHVPVVIARSPPGQYRHYKGEGHGNHGKGHGKPDKHDD
jgi:hypothetical protein